MAIFTVPSGTTAFITKWDAGVIADDSAQVKSADFELYTKEIGKSKKVRDAMGLKDNHHIVPYGFPLEVSAMSDIWVEGTAKTNATRITGGFEVEINFNTNEKYISS